MKFVFSENTHAHVKNRQEQTGKQLALYILDDLEQILLLWRPILFQSYPVFEMKFWNRVCSYIILY